MNILYSLLLKCAHCLTLVCVAGGLGCVAFLALYSSRRILRDLLEKLSKSKRCNVVAFLVAVAAITPFAGAKHGSETNDLSGGVTGGNSPTNDPPPMMMAMLPPPSQTTNNQQLTAISNWTARGAYCDWKRIDFPDTFAFPSGTNLLTGVTLMAYGELRPSLLPNPYSLIPPLAALPQAVSLEPSASSVSYGLTSSNSFVFVWENACVNRDSTNRVNASIELFEDGAIAITTQFGDQPPTTNYQLPTNPPGFIGEGQNEEWATNTFAFAADAIAEKGYDSWLMEDHVGYNEPNGRYKCSVTIAALPGNGPCYLVCGPHRIVVKHPGTYSFPLEEMTDYEAYTCPVAVPLSISYDDGYRPDPDPYMMMAAPMMATSGGNGNGNNHYPVRHSLSVGVSPSNIPLAIANGMQLSIWFNWPGAVVLSYETLGDIILDISGRSARIRNAICETGGANHRRSARPIILRQLPHLRQHCLTLRPAARDERQQQRERDERHG